jgi:hypothetical protein
MTEKEKKEEKPEWLKEAERKQAEAKKRREEERRKSNSNVIRSHRLKG